MGLRPSLKADISLLGVAAIWGCTFVVVKRALEDASPFTFMAVRFSIGALILGVVYRRRILPVRRSHVKAGALLALFIGGGFACQTLGLLETPASRSAFITGLYVVMVPLMAAFLGMRGLTPGSLAGAGLALGGLWLMTARTGSGEAGGLGRGELFTLACAGLFAAHIIGVDMLTRRHPAGSLAFWQVALTAAACLPLALLERPPRLVPTPALLGALAVTGIAATALTLAVQNGVQALTTPARAAIIFASEPVFAAATSWAVDGEVLGGAAALGAGLILAGMLVAELPGPRGAGSTA